ALVTAIHTSQLTPAAVEYIADCRLQIADWDQSTITNLQSAILIRAEGLPAAVERHIRDVAAMAQRAGSPRMSVLRDEDHTAVWAAINDLPQTFSVADDELLLRLGCLPSELERALADASALASRQGVALAVAARALSGIAYLRVRGGDEGARYQFHADLLARWPQLAILAGPPALMAEAPIWGATVPNLALMQRIKQEFDPDNRLNPGRYVV
ncbi:MAG: FAD-linked oxidase C-terminal domain-containing protein, partial [Chloroflexales bacterium]